MQSHDERDMEGLAARKERDGTVKEFPAEEITGRYEGEELEARRSARSPDERFSNLEKKHDELKQDVEKKHDELKQDVREVRSDVKGLSGQVADVRADVAGAVAKLDGQEKFLTETLSIVKKSAERHDDRAHLTLTAELDVDRAHKLAQVEVEKEVQLMTVADKIDAKRSKRVDTLDARKKRREALLKALGFAVGGGGLIELLHKLGVL